MYTMEEIVAAEKERALDSFTNEDGWKLGLMARKICMERNLPMTICVEKCGQVVFQCALEGSLTVSGLADTDDHELVMEILKMFKEAQQ